MSTVLNPTLTKFLVSSAALLRVTQNAALLVTRNPIMPVLENVHFELRPNALRVSGCDLENHFISRPLPIEGFDALDDSICVPAKSLAALLKAIPAQPLTILLDEQAPSNNYPSLHVHATTHALGLYPTDKAEAYYELSGESGGDFPRVHTVVGKTTVTIPGHMLHTALMATVPVCSTDELRPAMTGVLVDIIDTTITFVATDGHRLIRYRQADQHTLTGPATRFILPRRAADLLLKLTNKREVVNVLVGTSHILVEMETGQLTIRLIDEKYPDYENVIPVNMPYHLVAHRLELLAAVKRAFLFCNRTTYQVEFELRESGSELKAQDLDFANRSSESVPGTYTGDYLRIGFNAGFLQSFLMLMPSQEVKISMRSPSRAGIITCADADTGLMALMMPVMINNYLD